MKLPRRRFLYLVAGAAVPPAVTRLAWAQAYPTQPVRIIVGFAAGSASDITARLMAQRLSERLGQQFVVENRPGAGGNIGTEAVAKAPSDGHTLLLVTPSLAINATLYERLNYDFNRDIAPVATMIHQPNVMVVNPSVPAKTVPEFIAYAKANPGKINFASSGNGSSNHLAGELFKMMAGIDIVHVPYRGGGPALTDLIGGQVQVYFGAPSTSIEAVRAGKLRVLAVSTVTRWEGLPDVPTVGEFVPGYEVITWFGLCAPRNTPAAIVNKLNKEINTALADPKMRARISDMGASPFAGSSSDFGKLIAEETEKWRKVIRSANIKPV